MKRIPERITARWLRRHGACSEQVAVVRREWPQGIRPLDASARKAGRLCLDAYWLVKHVLPRERVTPYFAAVAPAARKHTKAFRATDEWLDGRLAALGARHRAGSLNTLAYHDKATACYEKAAERDEPAYAEFCTALALELAREWRAALAAQRGGK